MKVIQFSYPVSAPADRVFACLVDFGQLARWRSLQSLRVEPEGSLRPGARLYTTVKGPGGTMRFVNEVTVVDAQRREYDDRSVDGTFPIESGWRVDEDGSGSRIRWITRYEARGPLRLLGPILSRMIMRGQLSDLKKFQAMLSE